MGAPQASTAHWGCRAHLKHQSGCDPHLKHRPGWDQGSKATPAPPLIGAHIIISPTWSMSKKFSLSQMNIHLIQQSNSLGWMLTPKIHYNPAWWSTQMDYKIGPHHVFSALRRAGAQLRGSLSKIGWQVATRKEKWLKNKDINPSRIYSRSAQISRIHKPHYSWTILTLLFLRFLSLSDCSLFFSELSRTPLCYSAITFA